MRYNLTMSAFFIAINRDCRPFDRLVADAMMTQLDRFGDDAKKLIVTDNYAIGFQSTWTLPEEEGEQQPLANGDNGWFAFYGRLDNRTELLAKLSRPADYRISDAALSQEYLENVGYQSLSDLIGPFVLLDYDARSGRLLLARDGMGARHLVYRVDQSYILASSYEMALVAHPSVDYQLNDETVGRHIASLMQPSSSSIIAGLEVLHPGHLLDITSGNPQAERFYLPDPRYRVTFASDEEYAAEFKRLLNQAVERRLRCVANVGSQLSGGLDSVPVTIAAAKAMPKRGKQLSAYSWVFDLYPEADERQYSSPICSSYAIEQVSINCDTRWLDYDDDKARDPLGPLHNPIMSFNQALFEQAKARGVKVMLNGIHGDILYGYTQGILYELLKSGKFKQSLDETRQQLRSNGSVIALIKKYLLSPLPIIMRFLKWRALRRVDHSEVLQSHIVKQFKRRPNLLEKESREAIRPQQWQVVLGGFAGRDAAIGRFLESEYSIERRYPFRDRDLCEFMLAIPSSQLALGGIKRPIVKRAFAAELPENMLNRNVKAYFSKVTITGMQNDVTNSHWANAGARDWSYYVKECYFDLKSEQNHQLEVVKWRCGYYDYWKSVCYNPVAKNLGLSNANKK
ncbi:MAG: asparagine synthase (glutamine-hydrolyzing) [Arenicella sp.]|jgi:asparagine synthase (glutamine-hydrolysing)